MAEIGSTCTVTEKCIYFVLDECMGIDHQGCEVKQNIIDGNFDEAAIKRIKDIPEPLSDKKYMQIANEYAKKSKCQRTKVGAVIVKNGIILSSGKNGAMDGIPACETGSICLNETMDAYIETGKPDTEYTCQRMRRKVKSTTRNDLCRGIHAEWDAILKCNPDNLKNATIYSTLEPCPTCIKIIARVGIKRIVFQNIYSDVPNEVMQKLAKDSNIEYIQLEA
jgi:dCMP deaminase